ncbi:MAG: 1,4-alpha-glucan branching protein GlgB [Butyricicoccus sp.]|nr:1,4-alpha-glucan branching protein GlgB [Butyricicoccus sp.]
MNWAVYTDNAAIERFISGDSSDAYKCFGCHYIPQIDAYSFTVWAPRAQNVSLVGDFNGWDANACPMQRLDNGAWVAVVEDAKHGQIYKYAVTGSSGETVWKTDPFAFHCETGPATGSKVWNIDGFEWTDGEYRKSREGLDILNAPMSIYEMHVGSWKRDGDVKFPWYRKVADQLAEYCADMGYTHVELLPITEYPYEGSWGYQVTGYFAPTSRYGTPQDFMYFVNRLHEAGIGVIIDWVPAHFPRDTHGLPYFDGQALYERDDPKMASHPDWGTLIFDYSKPHVQSFMLSSAGMFIREYHVDGLRVDAVSSMLYLGYGRGNDFTRNREGGDIDLGAIELLQRVNTLAAELGAVTVAEESTAYPRISAPAKDGGLGFTFKWDMGFMHDMLDYLALNPLFRRGSHNKLTFSMMYAFSEHFVLAFSHDEVVHGKKSMVDKMFGDYDQKFSTLRTLFGFQYAHPGKKLNFMGAEIGQFIEWNPSREIDWFLTKYPRHEEMQRFVRELNRFYLAHPAMYSRDTGWDGYKWLNVDDRDRSSIAFMRMADGESVVCVCNFTPMTWELQAGLPGPGTLELCLNSDEYCYGGTGQELESSLKSEKKPFLEFRHSVLVKLPPLSVQYYIFNPGEEEEADELSETGAAADTGEETKEEKEE